MIKYFFFFFVWVNISSLMANKKKCHTEITREQALVENLRRKLLTEKLLPLFLRGEIEELRRLIPASETKLRRLFALVAKVPEDERERVFFSGVKKRRKDFSEKIIISESSQERHLLIPLFHFFLEKKDFSSIDKLFKLKIYKKERKNGDEKKEMDAFFDLRQSGVFSKEEGVKAIDFFVQFSDERKLSGCSEDGQAVLNVMFSLLSFEEIEKCLLDFISKRRSRNESVSFSRNVYSDESSFFSVKNIIFLNEMSKKVFHKELPLQVFFDGVVSGFEFFFDSFKTQGYTIQRKFFLEKLVGFIHLVKREFPSYNDKKGLFVFEKNYHKLGLNNE